MDIQALHNLIQESLGHCLDQNKPYVLWDFPNHSNVGDSAIWLGELAALKEFFGCGPLHTCIASLASPLPPLPTDVQILLHGGGNFGDLWEPYQLFRERVVASYPHNKIVILPQSVHFNDQTKAQRCRKIFSEHPDLTVMVRDHLSYQLATQLFDGRLLLVPDMAFAMGHQKRPTVPTSQIIALLRTDKEANGYSFESQNEGFIVTDWLDEPQMAEPRLLSYIDRLSPLVMRYSYRASSLARNLLFEKRAFKRFLRGSSLLSSGKVVITDRLHGHILCVLMDIPHIVLDNSYGKISRFRKAWSTGDSANCLEAPNLEVAFEKSNLLLSNRAL